jgi:hypothetical protein
MDGMNQDLGGHNMGQLSKFLRVSFEEKWSFMTGSEATSATKEFHILKVGFSFPITCASFD